MPGYDFAGEENLRFLFSKRVDKAAALSSISNPLNVSSTSAPSSSSKGTPSTDRGPGSSSTSKAKHTRRGTPLTLS